MEKQKEEKALENVGTGPEKTVDTQSAQSALEQISQEPTQQVIKIREEDLRVIVQEMDLERTEAENVLLRNQGNVISALTELVTS